MNYVNLLAGCNYCISQCFYVRDIAILHSTLYCNYRLEKLYILPAFDYSLCCSGCTWSP